MVGIYTRLSREKNDSLSCDMQRAECVKKLNLKEGEYEEYRDEGKSGKDTNRKELQRLIADIKKGKINTVIAYKVDRMSRNVVDFYGTLYSILKENKCAFLTVADGVNTEENTNDMMMAILAVMAQTERDNTVKRVLDNYEYRVKTYGSWGSGSAPYGKKIGRTSGGKATLENTPDIEAVKEIHRLYYTETHTSLYAIATEIQRQGYSGKWTSAKVAKILQNPVYVKADKLLYEYFDARKVCFLNDKDKWNGKTSCQLIAQKQSEKRTQYIGNADISGMRMYLTNFEGEIESFTYIRNMERLRQNKKTTNAYKSANKLQELGGKLKCAHCGYAIKAHRTSTKDGRPYLVCSGRALTEKCEHKYNKFNFYDIQNFVADEIQIKLDNMMTIKKRNHKRRKRLKKQIAKLEKEKKNYMKASGQSEELNMEYVHLAEEVEEQIKPMREALSKDIDIMDTLKIPALMYSEEEHKKMRTKYEPTQAMGVLEEIDFKLRPLDEKQYIVQSYIDRILLDDETGTITIKWNEGIDEEIDDKKIDDEEIDDEEIDDEEIG